MITIVVVAALAQCRYSIVQRPSSLENGTRQAILIVQQQLTRVEAVVNLNIVNFASIGIDRKANCAA